MRPNIGFFFASPIFSNEIANFDGVTFPNLRKLNINDNCYGLVSPPHIILPGTFTHLHARGTHIDWPAVTFSNLITMEVSCRSVRYLKFPGTLQTLRLCIDPWAHDGEDLCLPSALTSLTLSVSSDSCGCDCWFDKNHENSGTNPISPPERTYG